MLEKMPSVKHEVLVQLFQNRPTLAAEILEAVLSLEVPAYESAQVQDATLSQVAPTEYHADHVVVLRTDRPILCIVVEVQLRIDAQKRFTWPVYVATSRARFQCPCCLLVVSPDPAVARWAGAPIDLGLGESFVSPRVLGPEATPRITDPRWAREAPELAMLSVWAHGRGPGARDVALAALVATSALDRPRAVLYSDLVLLAVPEAVQRELEELMPMQHYVPQSEMLRKPVR